MARVWLAVIPVTVVARSRAVVSVQQKASLLRRQLPPDLLTQRVVGIDGALAEGCVLFQVVVLVTLQVDHHPIGVGRDRI